MLVRLVRIVGVGIAGDGNAGIWQQDRSGVVSPRVVGAGIGRYEGEGLGDGVKYLGRHHRPETVCVAGGRSSRVAIDDEHGAVRQQDRIGQQTRDVGLALRRTPP